MTWHFEARMLRKNLSMKGAATFIFESRKHSLWYHGAETDVSFETATAHIYLHDREEGVRAIKDRRWDIEDVFKRFGTEYITDQTSWINYWSDSNQIDVSIILSDAKLLRLEEDLRCLLHGSRTMTSFMIRGASFSSVESNPYTRRPTRAGFMNGDTLMTEDDFSISFVVAQEGEE